MGVHQDHLADKMLELSVRVRGHQRAGYSVKSYFRNAENAMQASTSDPNDPTGWEYKKVNNVSATQMNALAKDGWESVSSAPGALAIPGIPFLSAEIRPITTVFRRKKGTVVVGDPNDIGIRSGRTAEQVQANAKARQQGMSRWEKFKDSATGGRTKANRDRRQG